MVKNELPYKLLYWDKEECLYWLVQMLKRFTTNCCIPSSAGSFELLRVPEGGGKMLDAIASPESGYTVSYLKAVVHHAKLFIRPLQREISLDPVKKDVC